MAMNSLGNGQLGRYGLDITNAADRTLLSSVIANNPTAAAHGISSPYAGFPGTSRWAMRSPGSTVGTVNPYLGPYRGNTWYDSLQFQATKRVIRTTST